MTTSEEDRMVPLPSRDDRRLRPSALWVDIKGPTDFLYRVWINRTFRKLVPGLVIFGVLLVLPRGDALSLEAQRVSQETASWKHMQEQDHASIGMLLRERSAFMPPGYATGMRRPSRLGTVEKR